MSQCRFVADGLALDTSHGFIQALRPSVMESGVAQGGCLSWGGRRKEKGGRFAQNPAPQRRNSPWFVSLVFCGTVSAEPLEQQNVSAWLPLSQAARQDYYFYPLLFAESFFFYLSDTWLFRISVVERKGGGKCFAK